MDARKFDALAMAMTPGTGRASRRRLLRGLAALAVVGLAPSVARAYDGGVAPVQPAVGSVGCTSGADCAAGEICLNGACAPRDRAGAVPSSQPAVVTPDAQPDDGTDASGASAATAPDPAAATTPDTTPVVAPDTAPDAAPLGGVGGLIQPGEPLPARIYAGRCGALGAEPAFQLIDIGSVEGVDEDETPQGALTAIPAEFSTTVVNTTLANLLAAEHAIDVRVDDADPATSIACGDIGGPVEAGAESVELAVGLQERGQSAYSGIGLLQDEGERTVVQVFLARGLDGADTALEVAQPAPEETVEAPAEPAAVEIPQVAATPEVGSISPLGAGSLVVTSIDVNLRAEPSEDAPVVTILGEGVELEVSGTPENGWLPVVEPASGQQGFVSDQFITLVN